MTTDEAIKVIKSNYRIPAVKPPALAVGSVKDRYVIAWMERPEPYREEQN